MGGVRFSAVATVPPPGCTGLPYSVSLFDDGFFVFKCAERILSGDEPQFEDISNPILSPDRTKIAFDINFPGPNGEGQIRSIPVGGGSYTVVSEDDPGGSYFLQPSWHPDSDTLIYIHADPTTGFFGRIVSGKVSDPQNETTLYTPPSTANYGPMRPQYNRDGTLIAFFLDGGVGATASVTGLYIMDADGSNVTQLDTWATASPRFSFGYDGSQLAWGPDDTIYYGRYSFTGGPNPQGIYKIQPDGTGMTQLTTDAETSVQNCRIANRAFLPDDSALIITSAWPTRLSTGWTIYQLALDGSGGSRLNDTHGPDNREYFRCAYVHPEDGRIWFVEQAVDDGVISSMAVDGSDYRVEENIVLITQSQPTYFYNGTGIEWN